MKKLQAIIGIGAAAPVSHTEKLISAVGGFTGILAIFLVSNIFLPVSSAAMIITSMGASAVLLFAIPHGPLSQPWPMLAGHVVSAVIGVSCAMLIPGIFLGSAVAVGLAIAAMHYIRAIHPPGGATALTAVAGGAEVQALGYQFVLTPILLNVIVILLIAALFNAPFSWRRYPAWFQKSPAKGPYDQISHADLVYALSEVDSYVDISESDLLRIYNLATSRSIEADHIHLSLIKLHHFYSDDEKGENRTVRQLVDEDDDGKTVIYKTISGPDVRSTGHVTRESFARWASYEVEPDEDGWKRVER